MGAWSFDSLRAHVGHRIAVVTYGEGPETVAAECEDCQEVLLDFAREHDLLCDACGEPMAVDGDGVSVHLTEDGDVDHDRDADHVAFTRELDENGL